MSKVNWTQVAIFGIVALLVFLIGASLLGGSGGWGPGWGMMGPGMMGGWGGWGFGPLGWLGMILMGLFPLGFLALLVLGGVWLFRQVGGSQGLSSRPGGPAPDKTCPSCGRAIQADWQLCPYCGQGLV